MVLSHGEREGFKLQPRFNVIWLFLMLIAGIFSLLYLWYVLFPGRADPEVFKYFTADQFSRAREYTTTLRLFFIGSFLIQAAVLGWLVFGGRAAGLSSWARELAGNSYIGGVLVLFLSVWMLQRLISLPFLLYGDYYWQHRWGFSTQTMGSWWIDYLKMAGIELVLTSLGVAVFFLILNRWPGTWWIVGASFLSVWLVIQSYIWPVAVAPLFNSFEPAKNQSLIEMVDALSSKAGVPVDKVLIMDASQRTTKANAYFAGLGKTKQIVLYDTLLEKYPMEQVEAVVAHEMAHWRQGHIVKGIALGIAGNFLLWGLLFLLIRLTVSIPWYMHYPPHTWIIVMLFFTLVSFSSSPLQNYFSRAMEREADLVAVQLTGNPAAAKNLHINLAAGNLSDLSPNYFIRWFSYSHPPVLERIETVNQAVSKQ
ncbi:Zn-dependent protease with chaperone function [Desulfocucumis palustris]|uniref:Zn-dependent protease with chaperone function n=1 Tax=Desulfocucumis palustris TaxID=1898651 RepID=A0A2L2XL13_9FIRM|nr:M48 family metallopeptidase [Desulfocucumis palustris]GBF34986.1 Zn-dependent protease with chaperone function [Desulfocucumis palustris]